MDLDKYLDGMKLMAAIFPATGSDTESAEQRLEAYHAAVSDLSNEEWALGVRRAIREEKWFPPPVRIRELAGPSELAIKSAAAIAFAKLFDKPFPRELTTYSPHTGEVLSREKVRDVMGDVVFEAFLVSGGCAAFDTASDGDRPFLEKRFVEAYREAEAEQRRTGELPGAGERGRLPGRVRELAAGVGREFPKAAK